MNITFEIPDKQLVEFRRVLHRLLQEYCHTHNNVQMSEDLEEVLCVLGVNLKEYCDDNLVCLCKDVCKKCRNKTKDHKWSDHDERSWISSDETVTCLGFIKFVDSSPNPEMFPTTNLSIYKSPPDHCAYKLEHLLSTQNIKSDDNVK